MTPTGDITSRFLEAWHRLEKKEGGRVKLNRFGELLGRALDGNPLPPSTIARWEKGAVPDLNSIAAIAAVSGVHPSWLAFGLGSPDDPLVGDVVIKHEPEVPTTVAGTLASVARTQVKEKAEAQVGSRRKAAGKKKAG